MTTLLKFGFERGDRIYPLLKVGGKQRDSWVRRPCGQKNQPPKGD